MIEIGNMALILIVGGILGVAFFGGLRVTIEKGLSSSHPAFWFFFSFWVRTGIVLFGFYTVADDDWRKILVCLVGFVIARLLVTWLTREPKYAI